MNENTEMRRWPDNTRVKVNVRMADEEDDVVWEWLVWGTFECDIILMAE